MTDYPAQDEYDPKEDGAKSYLAAIAAKKARGDDYYLKPKPAPEPKEAQQ